MQWLKKHKTLIGIVLSLVFLYLAFRKISWQDLRICFSSTSPWLIVNVVLINYVIRLILAYRWNLLLKFSPDVKIVSVYHHMNIGYLINNLLPARLGDFIKALLIAKKFNLNKTNAVASIAIERLLDMLGLGMVFLLALIILKLPAYIREGGFMVIIMVILAILFLIIFHNRFRPKEITDKSGFFPKVWQWMMRRMEMVFTYTGILKNVKTLLFLFLSTTAIWFLYIFIGYLISMEVNPDPFSWQISILTLLIISVSFILPSTPGNLGIYQFACVLAFGILGLPKTPAIVYSLISQFPVYFMSLALGFYSMWTEGFSLRSLKMKTQSVADEQ
jgi:glycosyltransferase 2 family protein